MFDVRPLRSVSFRHLVAGLWINETGNALGEVALALLVYDRTGSALASAALFLALRFLPAVAAPVLATYAEALPPRIVLPTIYIAEAGLFAAMAAISHHFSLPLVLALVAIDGVLAISSAALNRTAITNNLLAAGLLREGNGLANLGTMVAFATGPLVAGLVIASHGVSTALLIDAATFLTAALIIVSAPGLHIESDAEAGTVGRIRAGVDVLRTRPAVRRLMVAIAIAVTMISVVMPIEVVFATSVLHAGSSGYGLMVTSWGVGMIIGGAIFALGRDVPLMRMLACSTALIAVSYAGLAISPTLAVACAFSVLGGTGNGAAWVAAMTSMQQRIPLNAQNVVMSVLYALLQVMPAVGFVIGGVVTSLSSPRVAYAISAIGIVSAVSVFTIHRIDQVRLSRIEEKPIKQDERDKVVQAANPPATQEIQLKRRNHDTPPVEIG